MATKKNNRSSKTDHVLSLLSNSSAPEPTTEEVPVVDALPPGGGSGGGMFLPMKLRQQPPLQPLPQKHRPAIVNDCHRPFWR